MAKRRIPVMEDESVLYEEVISDRHEAVRLCDMLKGHLCGHWLDVAKFFKKRLTVRIILK